MGNIVKFSLFGVCHHGSCPVLRLELKAGLWCMPPLPHHFSTPYELEPAFLKLILHPIQNRMSPPARSPRWGGLADGGEGHATPGQRVRGFRPCEDAYGSSFSPRPSA